MSEFTRHKPPHDGFDRTYLFCIRTHYGPIYMLLNEMPDAFYTCGYLEREKVTFEQIRHFEDTAECYWMLIKRPWEVKLDIPPGNPPG